MSVGRRPTATAAFLAFTAGFVDTAGFIALFGLFTAHVTGNFVLIGAALTGGGTGLIGKLLALPAFVLAVAAARLFVLGRERAGRDATAPLLLSQAALLLLFMALGLAAHPVQSADEPLAIAAGLAGVAAMGVQNVASRTVFANLAPTTVMTGNVTQVVMDLVDLASGGAEPPARTRLGRMWPPVAAFAIGAVAGAIGFVTVGFWCLLGAITAVLAAFPVRQQDQ